MGISVSESNAVKEQKIKSKLRSQRKKEQIRNELEKGPNELGWKNEDKENVEGGPSSVKAPRQYQNNNGNALRNSYGQQEDIQRMKGGVGVNRRSENNRGGGAISGRSDFIESSRPGIQGEINQIVDRNKNNQQQQGQKISSDLPITATKITPVGGRNSISRQLAHASNVMQGGHIYQSPRKVSPSDMELPPTTAPKESEGRGSNLNGYLQKRNSSDFLSAPRININQPGSMKSAFDEFDWTIPGEESIRDQMIRKDQMPSMNLVLTNKFNENIRELDENQEEIFRKNRRQMMRELLAGKREGMEDNFKMPSCGDVKNLC